MQQKLKYLLLQVRNPQDPMRAAEVTSFAAALNCDTDSIKPRDLLLASPGEQDLAAADLVLIGGSGHYSATAEAPWLERSFDLFRELHQSGKPTFGSCWGFQAIARALGGQVIRDPARAELGTHTLHLTEAGRQDPVFGYLGDKFVAQMGHEDRVAELPPGATLLASSQLVANQAFCFPGRPLYCTQFHPELTVRDMLARVRTYPEYVERIVALPPERFDELCCETLEAARLLQQFVRHVFG